MLLACAYLVPDPEDALPNDAGAPSDPIPSHVTNVSDRHHVMAGVGGVFRVSL